MKNVVFVDFKSKKKVSISSYIRNRLFGTIFSKIANFAKWLDENIIYDSKMIQVIERRNSILLIGTNGQVIKFNKKTIKEISKISKTFTYPGTTEQVQTVTRYKTDKVVQVDFKNRTYQKEAYQAEIKTRVQVKQEFLIESAMGVSISSFTDSEIGPCVVFSGHYGMDRIPVTRDVFTRVIEVLNPTSQFKRPALVHSIDEKAIS